MGRTKVDYGIDLGTTNSAISRMESGEVRIIKSLDTQSDTTPSCVSFRRNGSQIVGDAAYRKYRSDVISLYLRDVPVSSFIEFKRTIGSDKQYELSGVGNYSSEELSSKVLQQLKSYIQDEEVSAAIITIPAAFKSNQIDATRAAAKMVGFSHVEMLQEPVAAAMAYGVDSREKDGYWLVFDFGGGTFDAALLKAEEGIMRVVDTEGDNYLGGKDLDYALVDELLLPYLQENYALDSIDSDFRKKSLLRDVMKFVADECKKQLSFNEEYQIYVDPGDLGEDDEGEEIEIELTVRAADVNPVFEPIFQKAIDLTISLLERNNLGPNNIASLILVGGPTYSPILRKMLTDQICAPETGVDPMTVVSRGAALYASTINRSEEVIEASRDRTKVQLEIEYPATCVDKEVFASIRVLPDKTDGKIPNGLCVNFVRGDDSAWETGRIAIGESGEVVELHLSEGVTNLFRMHAYDGQGSAVDIQPDSFSIIQGTVVGAATLPYNIGIEIFDVTVNKNVFRTIEGLEKNKSLPATGIRNSLKTPIEIRPGMRNDSFRVPIFQGGHGSDGTRAVYNEHVDTITVTGADLPSLLPAGSDVDIAVDVDRSQGYIFKLYFPYLDFEIEAKGKAEKTAISIPWLEQEFKKAGMMLEELRSKAISLQEYRSAEQDIISSEREFLQNREDTDTRQKALSNLRKGLKIVDGLLGAQEWPELQKELTDAFRELQEINNKKGNAETTRIVEGIKNDVEQAIRKQDPRFVPELISTIHNFSFELERLEHWIGFVLFCDKEYNTLPWKDRAAARNDINRGKAFISQSPTLDNLEPIVADLWRNAGFGDGTGNDIAAGLGEGLLRG